MPTFTTYDGTELTCRVVGNGNPLVVVPGGPLRATRYLGDLGGFGPEQELVMLELPPRRVDEIVADVDALREHLGVDRLDLLAHSAGGDLALLYAAAHPDRVRKLALITVGASAVGIDVSDDVFRAALQRRSAEPWFDEAHAAILAWDAGDASRANRAAAMPFFYGRWDEVAQAHAAAAPDERDPDSAATYYADAHSIRLRRGRRCRSSTPMFSCSSAGSTPARPSTRANRWPACSATQSSSYSRVPGTTRGSTTPRHSSRRSVAS